MNPISFRRIGVKRTMNIDWLIDLPVINGGGVGLRLVEHIGADGLGGQIATWVEHTPPHIVRRPRRRRRHRRLWTRRHRQRSLILPPFSLCIYTAKTEHQNWNQVVPCFSSVFSDNQKKLPVMLVAILLSLPRPRSGWGPAKTSSQSFSSIFICFCFRRFWFLKCFSFPCFWLYLYIYIYISSLQAGEEEDSV